MGDANNGQSSVTGVKAYLAGEGVMVSTDEVFQVCVCVCVLCMEGRHS